MSSGNPEKIGRYQILERVGRGGMGVLYRGIDPVLDREVAIKLMLMDFSEDTENMRPRFYREARAAAKLQHPNIVTVFEFAEDGNTPYIVMEFLNGMSLQARMASPLPLTLDEKLHAIAQLCSALNYAHEQGIVHRDIKPANLFLLPDGSVKLLDFGVAKLATSTMTRKGDVLGSAMYMSPEQVSGTDTVDGRSDIFSVGVMLYEVLANRKPFQADTLTATVVRILREDPPSLDSVAPGLPPQLVKAVMKALAKEPENRFKTAGEMAKELQWIRQALQASVQSPGALEETRFATPAQLAELQKELEKDRIAAGEPRPEYETEAAAPAAGRKSLVPAIVGVAAVILAVVAYVWFGRTPPASDPNTKPASVATPGTKDVPQKPEPPAVAETVSLRVESTPPGAAVSLDGRPTNQTTPTTLSLPSAGAHRLSLSKVGFVTQEVNLAEADLKQGLVKYALAPAEETGVPVTIESTYPVEVISGSRTISRASQSHRLRVPAGATLRITAKEYLLNATLRASGPSVSYQAPGIGHLTVLTRHETCNVKIGERVLGFPPITRMPIAAGQYRIDIACPTGQNPPGQFVTIAPNETATARIF